MSPGPLNDFLSLLRVFFSPLSRLKFSRAKNSRADIEGGRSGDESGLKKARGTRSRVKNGETGAKKLIRGGRREGKIKYEWSGSL